MQIQCSRFLLREWRRGDEASLIVHANHYNIWRNVRDRFPHPYTIEDALAWIDYANEPQPQINFAIEADAQAVGGIGILPQEDVYRCTAEIGYWLSEDYKGRGIMTEAVRAVTDYAFATFDLHRLYASVFAWNPASGRVLEKAGYQLEGIRRKSVIKENQVMDDYLYARVRE